MQILVIILTHLIYSDITLHVAYGQLVSHLVVSHALDTLFIKIISIYKATILICVQINYSFEISINRFRRICKQRSYFLVSDISIPKSQSAIFTTSKERYILIYSRILFNFEIINDVLMLNQNSKKQFSVIVVKKQHSIFKNLDLYTIITNDSTRLRKFIVSYSS